MIKLKETVTKPTIKQLQLIAMTQAAGMETDDFSISANESDSIENESANVPNESYKMTQQMAPPMLQMGTGKSLPELTLVEQKKKSEQNNWINQSSTTQGHGTRDDDGI